MGRGDKKGKKGRGAGGQGKGGREVGGGKGEGRKGKEIFMFRGQENIMNGGRWKFECVFSAHCPY